MLVVYYFYSSNILVDRSENRQAGTIKTAFILINDRLYNGGVIPKLYLLDN